jgi:hypothetical protein
MRRVSVFIALTLFVIAGCSGEEQALTAPTMEAQVQNTSASSFNNAPAESGVVVRGGRIDGVYFIDAKRGLTAFLGFDPVELCDGTATGEFIAWQDINLPQHEGRIVEILQGRDMQMSVWPFASEDCADYYTGEAIGYGRGDVVSTDNDLLAWFFDRPSSNAANLVFHGSITTDRGESLPVNVVFHVTWDGEGVRKMVFVTKISVRGY